MQHPWCLWKNVWQCCVNGGLKYNGSRWNSIGIFKGPNLVKFPIYHKDADNKSTIELIVTNKPKSFKISVGISKGLSYIYEMVITSLALLGLGGIKMTPSTTHLHAKSKLYILKSSTPSNFPKFQIVFRKYCNTYCANDKELIFTVSLY